jgi:hypothetical protein
MPTAVKDMSELFRSDPENFEANLRLTMERAVPFAEISARRRDQARAESAAASVDLARQPRILDVFPSRLAGLGHVGEQLVACVLFLAIVSRRLERPVSVVLKGVSAAGKSFTAEQVLRFFTPEAHYAMTGMSERALVYSDESLAHRMLVIYEASGLSGEFASYLVRSLLSEGRLVYTTVIGTEHGPKAVTIEREGPTGLIITTTALDLHPENETRLLSLTLADTPEQTTAVMLAAARDTHDAPDLIDFHALDQWLSLGPRGVAIPFAENLAQAVPPIATRLRRDFRQVLSLVRAHALLHQATRETDEDGRVIATLEDYTVVRELVIEVLSEGVEAIVPAIVRETVEAIPDQLNSLSVTELAELLHLDKSSASRRVQQALELGYLANDEERRGYPARLRRGLPLPAEIVLLPTVETLQRCTAEGPDDIPPPDASDASGVAKHRDQPSLAHGAETQLALGEEHHDHATTSPGKRKIVDEGAVARLRERHPELRDWPLEELVKLAPSIIRNELHAEREPADQSDRAASPAAARAQPARGRRSARRFNGLLPAASPARDPLRPPRPPSALPDHRTPALARRAGDTGARARRLTVARNEICLRGSPRASFESRTSPRASGPGRPLPHHGRPGTASPRISDARQRVT